MEEYYQYLNALMNPSEDTIYAKPFDRISDFQFDDKVAGVFNDMVERSVPGYRQIINTLGHFADKFVLPNTNVYDLGCSLGAATLSVRRRIEQRNCQIIAIDNSQAMVERCRQNLQAYVGKTPVDLICGDIRQLNISGASMVILNFTLQFLAPEERKQLINNIYQGLVPGGLLVLSEKIIFDDPTIQSLVDDLHVEFKRTNGYSELEISQKRSSLERVMKPDSLLQHQHRLTQQGFSHFNVWYQCFNFASMVAIK